MFDLTNLKFRTVRASGGSYGCYPKTTQIINGEKYYYKCSNFYSGTEQFGDESWYELICSRLFDILGIPHVHYDITEARIKLYGKEYTTYLSVSKDFLQGYVSRMTLEKFKLNYSDCSIMEMIKQCNFTEAVNYMIVADFITLQRDRHGGNIEVLIDENENITLAPLFDNGLSFFAPHPSYDKTSIQRVENFDLLGDKQVNNYIGENSLYENLKLLSSPVELNVLYEKHRETILDGVHLPDIYLDAVWKMINLRYNWLRTEGYIVTR